jgi:hypothetical protein
VEHQLAPGVLAAGVVDARQPRLVGQVAHDEPVVADRRAEDREDAQRLEVVEAVLDVACGAEREPARQVRHELDGAVEATGRRHVVEAQSYRVEEACALVGLGEVEQRADEDGGGRHLHGRQCIDRSRSCS